MSTCHQLHVQCTVGVKRSYGLSFRLERLQLQTEVLGGGTEQPMVFESWPRDYCCRVRGASIQ